MLQISLDFLGWSWIPINYLPVINLSSGVFQPEQQTGIAHNSSFDLKTTLYLQIIFITQLTILLILFGIIYLLIYGMSWWICWTNWCWKFWSKSFEFLFIVFPVWFLIENFFIIYITFILEYKDLSTQLSKILYSVSSIVLTLYFILLIILISMIVFKQASWLKILKRGLK